MTRVLLMEDDPGDRLQVREALAESRLEPFDLEECDCLSQGLVRIREGDIDAVLLGPSFFDGGDLATGEAIREASSHLAIVELTGSAVEEDRDPEARSRTQDGLTRGDFDGRCLGMTIRHAIERSRLSREIETQAEALERSKAELQELAHVASHDLREPLRMVGSYVQLLARGYEGQLGEEADRFIGYVSEGAARMKAMIDDLLRYSRVGRGEAEREPVALGEVFEEAVTSLESRIRDAGAQVVVDELPTVVGSPQQLYELLRNLIDNALEYRSETPPEIHVCASCEGACCTVSVSDNGIGFEHDQAERIFRPFQRLHGRNEYSGNGIGLALVRRIAERHGGRVWAESEIGAGSVFHVSLSLYSGSAENRARTSSEKTTRKGGTP